MTKGEQLLENMRQARRSGDPRLTDSDRDILRRVTIGDLADDFGDALDGDLHDDELLGGTTPVEQ